MGRRRLARPSANRNVASRRYTRVLTFRAARRAADCQPDIRTIYVQPDPVHVREQVDTIAGMLGRQLPQSRGNAARGRQ